MRQYAIITLLFLSIVLGLSITQPAKAATQSLGGTWSVKAGMPTPREGLGAGTAGSKLYAIEAYDTASNTWRILAPLPSPRSDAYAVEVSGKIYVIGGFSSTFSNSTSSFLSTIQAYDIISNTWSTLAPMPTPRDHVVAGVCGNDIFVIGGATNPFFTATSVV